VCSRPPFNIIVVYRDACVCGLEDHFFSTSSFTLSTVVPGGLYSSDNEVNK